MMADDSSDSDSEDKDENRRVPLRLDDWLSFKVDSEVRITSFLWGGGSEVNLLVSQVQHLRNTNS